jgi:hypothetical protein
MFQEEDLILIGDFPCRKKRIGQRFDQWIIVEILNGVKGLINALNHSNSSH